MSFGNSVVLGSLADDARALDAAAFSQRHAPAFLLCNLALDSAGTNPRTHTLSLAGPLIETSPSMIFSLLRRPQTRFDFISVGRHENNDIYMPAPSVSRFHAYLKQQGADWVVQDCGSQNGTRLNDQLVPRQREGAAVRVVDGDRLRFGDVQATFISAAPLLVLLRKVAGVR